MSRLVNTPTSGVDEVLEALLYARGKLANHVASSRLLRHLPPRTLQSEVDGILTGLDRDAKLDVSGGKYALTLTGLAYARHHRRQRKVAVT